MLATSGDWGSHPTEMLCTYMPLTIPAEASSHDQHHKEDVPLYHCLWSRLSFVCLKGQEPAGKWSIFLVGNLSTKFSFRVHKTGVQRNLQSHISLLSAEIAFPQNEIMQKLIASHWMGQRNICYDPLALVSSYCGLWGKVSSLHSGLCCYFFPMYSWFVILQSPPNKWNCHVENKCLRYRGFENLGLTRALDMDIVILTCIPSQLQIPCFWSIESPFSPPPQCPQCLKLDPSC